MKIEAETTAGKIVWDDGNMCCSSTALAQLHKADPDGCYGPMPGVSLENAFHSAAPFYGLILSVFPDAKMQPSPEDFDDAAEAEETDEDGELAFRIY